MLVDPSLNIYGADKTYDTFVSSKNGCSNKNYYTDPLLRVGKCSSYEVCRSFISFKLPSSVTGADVTEGYIRIKKNAGAPAHIRPYKVLERWESKYVTWFNQPLYADNSTAGVFVLDTNNWYKIAMNPLVKEWCQKPSRNYGIALCSVDESSTAKYAEFCSSDYGYPNRPELHIVYMPAGNASHTYYINNKYWGKYIHRVSDSAVNTVSGLISNYGNSIRWVATDIGNGRYTLHPENDTINYLVDDTTSGIRLNAVPTTENMPNKFLWSITTLSDDEKLIKNLGTNRYLCQTGASAVAASANIGSTGTDAYKKCVWRVTVSNDYKELSNFTIPAKIMLDVNKSSTISFGKTPANAMWSGPSDFNYSLASGTSGVVSVNSSTGKITAKKYGTATYKITHKVTGRSKTVKIYVDGFTERLVNHFGFADNAATLIREVYDRVDRYYQNESVYKRAWRSSRLLSSFVYNDSNFNDLAGLVTPFSNLENYFTQVLNFSPQEFNAMSTAIENQYGYTSTPDFAHEQYALSTRLAYRLELGIFGEYPLAPTSVWLSVFDGLSQEEKSYFGGWLGDATFTGKKDFYNYNTTVLKNDDYCADLDAENIFRLIENAQDMGIVSAYKTYHSSLTASNTRAKVFKTYVDFGYIKEKVFYILVVKNLWVEYYYAALTGNSQRQNEILSQVNDEDYIMNEIRTKYPDTYNFLNSLRDGLAELRSYE